MRTFSIVALGSALFSIVGVITFGEGDAGARIAAQVVTGVGFLGAGTILHQRGSVIGLTTAAGIWGAAAVGMGFGFGLYILSAGSTLIMLALLRIIGYVFGTSSARATPTGTPRPSDPDDVPSASEGTRQGPTGPGL